MDASDDIVTSPLGAALLDVIEHGARRARDPSWFRPFGSLPDSRDDDVAAGELWAADATANEVRSTVVSAGVLVGPWTIGAPQDAARVLALAPRRRAIADALVRRADGVLAPLPMSGTQWWWTDVLPDLASTTSDPARLHDHPAWVTAPRGGLWTTSPVALDLADQLTDEWEMVVGPRSVWAMAVEDGARILEVHSPADWCALVRRHPHDVTPWVHGQGSWELSGRTFPDGDPASGLVGRAHDAAVRRRWRRVLLPDWAAVAESWDAVHLSWRGVVTTEGHVMDLDDGDVTIVRNWRSERTTWLRPRLVVTEEVTREPTAAHWRDRPGRRVRRTADEERAYLDAVVRHHRR